MAIRSISDLSASSWCLLIAGCSPPGPGAHAVIVDSAGVEIITNVNGTWVAGESWSVDVAPAIDIGGELDSQDGQLYRVRDAVRWNQEFVVLNGATDDLRVFDEGGKYRSTIGRRGRGPGEFQGLGFLRVLDEDSLITWDFENDRVSVFDRTGQLGRLFYLERDDAFGAFLWPTALLAGRRLLTNAGHHMSELQDQSGRFTDSITMAVHDLAGGLDHIIGSRVGGERVRFTRDGLITTLGAPFERMIHVTSWLDDYCLGYSAAFEIACHGPGGEVRRIVRLDLPPRPVTPSLIDRYVDEQLAVRAEGYGQAFRRIRDDLTYPETLPRYRDMKSDPAGNLWVQRYQAPGEPEASWWVFDNHGFLLGQLSMPDGLEVFRFYNDAVLGLWKDSLDVEHVRLHRLVK